MLYRWSLLSELVINCLGIKFEPKERFPFHGDYDVYNVNDTFCYPLLMITKAPWGRKSPKKYVEKAPTKRSSI